MYNEHRSINRTEWKYTYKGRFLPYTVLRFIKPLGQPPQEIVTVNFTKGDLVKFLPYTVLGSDFAPNPHHTWTILGPDDRTLVKLTKKPGDRAILTEVTPGFVKFKEGKVTYGIDSQFVEKCPQPILPTYTIDCSDTNRRVSHSYKKGDKAVLVLTSDKDQVRWKKVDDDSTSLILKNGDVITVDLDVDDSVIIELDPAAKVGYNNADLSIHKTKIVPFDEAAQALKLYTLSTLLDKELHDKLHLIASQRQTTIEKIAKSLLVTYLGNPDQQVYLTDGFPADPTPPPHLVTALNSVLDDLYPKVLEEARQQGVSFIDTLKGIVGSYFTMTSMARANPDIQFIDSSEVKFIPPDPVVTLDQIVEAVDTIVAKRLGENKPKRPQYEHKFVNFPLGIDQDKITLTEVDKLGKRGWRVANSRLVNIPNCDSINRVVFYRERKSGLTPKEIIALAFSDTRWTTHKGNAKKATQARIALLNKWRTMRSKLTKDEQAKFVKILREDLDMSIDIIATGLGLSVDNWNLVESGGDTWVIEVMERIGDFYKERMQPPAKAKELTPSEAGFSPNIA